MSPQERLELGLFDPVFFLRYYLPEWFPDRIPWVHRGVAAIITRQPEFLLKYGELDKIERHFRWADLQGNLHPIFDFSGSGPMMTISPNSNIIMPRGYSKTTLVNGLTVQASAYKLFDYLLYVSETGPHAEDQVTAIRREWDENELLIEDFGAQGAGRGDSRKWTNDVLEFRNGFFLRGIGRGGQVRGKQFRSRRPNRIVCDDLENEESVSTPGQREKTKNWYYGALVNALPPPGRRESTDGIINLGTLLGAECLLRTVANDPAFNTIVFGALDLDGEPLWPEQESLEQLNAARESARRTGTLHIFSREKLSVIQSEEGRLFPEDSFLVEPLDTSQIVACAIACDPAISRSASSSAATVYVVGKHAHGTTWVLDAWSQKGPSPRELVDTVFEMRNRWNTVLPCGVRFVGIESIAYQQALIFLAREEMAKRNDYFEISPLRHSTAKPTRIRGVLQPRYAARMMRHLREFPGLFSDLRDFPNGTMDDADAAAMGVALLEPFTGVGLIDGDAADENEYPPLSPTFARSCP